MKIRCLMFSLLAAGSLYGQSAYDESGFSEVRGFSNVTPEESIDPFSGNLIIVQPDLSVSGRAGLDLKLTRYYNSKIHENFAYNNSPPVFVAPSPVGLGWNLHLGRLYNPAPGNHNGLNSRRRYQSPDGASHEFYRSNDSNCPDCLVSKSGFVLRRNEPDWEISTPDGRVITFAHQASYVGLSGGLELIWYATSVEDVHGNSIEIEYRNDDNPLTERWNRHFIQRITDSFGRVFTFNYQDSTNWSRLVSIAGAGYTIRYHYLNDESFPGYSFLQKVDVGTGLEWSFEYAGVGTQACTFSKLCELTSIVYPYGGRLDYTFETQIFQDTPTHPQRARVVTEKRQSGAELQGATWSFRYNRGTDSTTDHTVITRPDGSEEAYTFFGPGQYSAIGSAWLYGAIQKKELRKNNQVVQEIQYEWEQSPPFSNEQYGTVFIGFDQGVSVPLPRRTVIRQDGGTWEMENRNFHPGNHLPQCIRRGGPSGDKFVIQTFRFDSMLERFRFASLPVAQISTFRDVCGQQNIPYQSGDNWQLHTYTASGLLEERNVNDALTTFEYDAFGQLQHQVDFRLGDSSSPADGVCTIYQDYSFGIARRVFHGADQNCAVGSALYEENNHIDQNGWISGRTNYKGTLSEVEYDALGRKIRVEEDGKNPILITYSGRIKTYRQGDVEVISEVDGLGREIARHNTLGGVTSTAYDSLGRVTFQSVPSGFTPGSGGSLFEYDVLGRRVRVEDERGLVKQYTYSADRMHTETAGPGIVSHEEIREYFSYGAPGQRLIRSLRLPGESASQVSEYTYSVAGDLLTASKNGVTKRAQYDARRNLLSEQTPAFSAIGEGGVARRFHYDKQGNVLCADYGPESGACGNGWPRTSFSYDRLNRLVAVEVIGQESENAIFEYEGMNQISVEQFGETVSGQKDGSYSQAREMIAYTYDDNLQLADYEWVHPYVDDGALAETELRVSYRYDGNGKLSQLVYPSGRVITYTYANGLPVSVRDSDTVYVSQIYYHDNGTVQRMDFGNGVRHTLNKDESFLPASLSVSNAGRPLVQLDFDFDAQRLLRGIHSTDESRGVGYTYDRRKRLTRATGNWGTVEYAYSSTGNRDTVSFNGATTTYNYTDSKLVSALGPTEKVFSYELGRVRIMDVDGVGRYEYEHAFDGQLTESMFTPTGGAQVTNRQTFFSHPRNKNMYRRTREINGCVSDTLYVHDSNGDLISEVAATGEFLKDYIVVGGRTVAELDYRNRLRLSGDVVDFGDVVVGEESIRELELYNDGADDVVLDEFLPCTLHEEQASGSAFGYSIGCDSSQNPFEIINAFPLTIPAEASVTLQVRFRPGWRAKSKREFQKCTGDQKLGVVFEGVGVQPIAVFEPTSVDFGDVALGSQSSQSVTLRNDGDAELVIEEWLPSAEIVRIEPETPWQIAPGEMLSFQVHLDANECPGEIEIRLERESNEGWAVPLLVRASVEGIRFEELEIDFVDAEAGQNLSRAFVFENRAEISLSPEWTLVGPDSFVLVDPPVTVPPLSSMEVRVGYAPRAALDTPFGDHALVRLTYPDCPSLCENEVHIRGRHAVRTISQPEPLDESWQVSSVAGSAEDIYVALSRTERQSSGWSSRYAHDSLFISAPREAGSAGSEPADGDQGPFTANSIYDEGGYRPVLLSAEQAEPLIWGYPTPEELVFYRGDLSADESSRCAIQGTSPRMPAHPFVRGDQGEIHLLWFEADLYASRAFLSPLYDASGACISDAAAVEIEGGPTSSDVAMLSDDLVAMFLDNVSDTSASPTVATYHLSGAAGSWQTTLQGNLWNSFPALAPAGEGALHTAFTRVTYGESYEPQNVYALICPNGALVDEGLLLEDATENGPPSLVADGAGRPMVAWTEARCAAEGTKRLYFARRNALEEEWEVLDVTPARSDSVNDGVVLGTYDDRITAAWIRVVDGIRDLQVGSGPLATTIASTYLDAECSASEPPDLDGGAVITDVAMPYIDGGDFVDALSFDDAATIMRDGGWGHDAEIPAVDAGGPENHQDAGTLEDAGDAFEACLRACTASPRACLDACGGLADGGGADVAAFQDAGDPSSGCFANCDGTAGECRNACDGGAGSDEGPARDQGCMSAQVIARDAPFELCMLGIFAVLFRRCRTKPVAGPPGAPGTLG